MGEDGYDAVEWAARQPWSNGRVGMIGVSFGGITQLVTAGQQPPHLGAIAASSATSDLYRDVAYPGGILEYDFTFAWTGIQRKAGPRRWRPSRPRRVTRPASSITPSTRPSTTRSTSFRSWSSTTRTPQTRTNCGRNASPRTRSRTLRFRRCCSTNGRTSNSPPGSGTTIRCSRTRTGCGSTSATATTGSATTTTPGPSRRRSTSWTTSSAVCTTASFATCRTSRFGWSRRSRTQAATRTSRRGRSTSADCRTRGQRRCIWARVGR